MGKSAEDSGVQPDPARFVPVPAFVLSSLRPNDAQIAQAIGCDELKFEVLWALTYNLKSGQFAAPLSWIHTKVGRSRYRGPEVGQAVLDLLLDGALDCSKEGYYDTNEARTHIQRFADGYKTKQPWTLAWVAKRYG